MNSNPDGRHPSMTRSISWAASDQPLYKEVNPQKVFDSLMMQLAPGGGNAENEAIAKLRRDRDLSVLDYVMDEAKALNPKLSVSDRRRLDQFLTSVGDIEARAKAQGTGMPSTGKTYTRPTLSASYNERRPGAVLEAEPDGYNRNLHAEVMNDLITMAFETNLTRVVSHMLDDARSEFEYRNIPAADRLRVGLDYNAGSSLHYHSSQHGPGDIASAPANGGYPVLTPSNLDFTAINYWISRKAAELAQRLDSIPEGAGTVLDNTVMVFMSEMRTHDHDGYDLPIVMLGGGGVFQQDAHVAYQALGKDRQLRDLWFTIMRQYFKMDITSFGDQAGGVPNALLQEILA
jgi:hypothetical protein